MDVDASRTWGEVVAQKYNSLSTTNLIWEEGWWFQNAWEELKKYIMQTSTSPRTLEKLRLQLRCSRAAQKACKKRAVFAYQSEYPEDAKKVQKCKERNIFPNVKNIKDSPMTALIPIQRLVNFTSFINKIAILHIFTPSFTLVLPVSLLEKNTSKLEKTIPKEKDEYAKLLYAHQYCAILVN